MKVSLDWNDRGTSVTARVNHLGFVFESPSYASEKDALLELVKIVMSNGCDLESASV